MPAREKKKGWFPYMSNFFKVKEHGSTVRTEIMAAVSDCFTAEATRKHNNANILCLGERVTGQGLAADLADIFLSTPFEGGRHLRRVQKFD